MDAQYREFYKQLNKSTSTYSDIMSVVKKARVISKQSKNAVLHSQAISMVLRHDDVRITPSDSVIDEYESKYIKEMFMYVDDKPVRDAVYDSFYDSKRKRNLIFIYNDVTDESKKARIRILTRMLVHKLLNLSLEGSYMSKKSFGRTSIEDLIKAVESDSTEEILPVPAVPEQIDATEDAKAEVTETVAETVTEVTEDTAEAAPEVTEKPKKRRGRAAKSEKAETTIADAEEVKVESDSKIKAGATYELPFTRLYQSSVAKLPICVCSGAVEILTEDVHDGRINVFNHGTGIRGWIDVTEIK